MNPKVDLTSADAACLVDLVTRYRVLDVRQVLLFYPGHEDRIRDLLTYFDKTGRLCLSRDRTRIACNEAWAASGCEAVEMAFWALLDFKNRIKAHFPGTDGVTITAYGGSAEYDFVAVPPGREEGISAQINAQREALSDRLVIVLRTFDQIPQVSVRLISAYCVVTAEGKTTYYTTPKELIPNEQNAV